MPFRIASLAFFQMLYRQNSTVVTTKTTSLMRLDLQFDHLNAHLFRLANRVNHDLTFHLVYIPFSSFFYHIASVPILQDGKMSHSSFESAVDS